MKHSRKSSIKKSVKRSVKKSKKVKRSSKKVKRVSKKSSVKKSKKSGILQIKFKIYFRDDNNKKGLIPKETINKNLKLINRLIKQELDSYDYIYDELKGSKYRLKMDKIENSEVYYTLEFYNIVDIKSIYPNDYNTSSFLEIDDDGNYPIKYNNIDYLTESKILSSKVN